MRVFLISSTLGSGGAERVISIIANYLVEFSYEVFLVSHNKIDNDYYPIKKKVNRIELSPLIKTSNPFRKIMNNYNAVKELEICFNNYKPDIIISFLYQVNVRSLIANRKSKFPIIISDRSNPELQGIELSWRALRYLYYKQSNKIIILSSRIKNQILSLPGIKDEDIAILPNPLPDYSGFANEDIKDLINQFHFDENEIIGSMGRLTHAKGYDLLIRAFKRIEDDVNYKLIIIGGGELKDELQNLINELGLVDRIILTGNLKNPFRLLIKFKMFVFTSRYEGFPNALLEAMSLGVPIISFDCDTGPREIITNNHDGILVKNGDIAELANAILKLEKDKKLRQKFKKNSKDLIKKYSVSHILNKWQSIIHETIGSR